MNARRAAIAAGLVAALVGCSGPAPTASPSVPPVVLGPTPALTSYSPQTTAWVDGFVVTLTTAVSSLDSKGGTVTVVLSIENPGADDATLDVPIVLTSGAATFQLAHGTELPDVASGTTSEASLTFDVFGQGSVDDGMLRIGRSADHVAVIPLQPGRPGLVDLKPRDVTLKNTGLKGTAGSLFAQLRHWQVRWDLPDWHDELPLATEALTVTYDVTYTGTFSGGIPFTADNVRIRLPDGTVLAPRADGHSQSIVAIGPGRTARGLTSRFEVPNGLAGFVAFVLRDGSAQKLIQFKVVP